MYGGLVGYNFQVNNHFVLGLEGDGGGVWGGRYSTGKACSPASTTMAMSATAAAISPTCAAVWAYAVDHALFYVAGGVAFSDMNTKYYNGLPRL